VNDDVWYHDGINNGGVPTYECKLYMLNNHSLYQHRNKIATLAVYQLI